MQIAGNERWLPVRADPDALQQAVLNLLTKVLGRVEENQNGTAAMKQYAQQSSILITPTAGGALRPAYAGPAILRFDGITWSHDSRAVIFSRQTGAGGKTELWSVPAAGG